ncbi:MAG: hypothetical protein ACOCX4_00030 [Planctomycetota bacterium]
MPPHPPNSETREILSFKETEDASILVYREGSETVCELSGRAAPWADNALLARCLQELKRAAPDSAPAASSSSPDSQSPEAIALDAIDLHLVLRAPAG